MTNNLISLPAIKEAQAELGPLFPLYLGTLTLFIENSITVSQCKAKILKLLPNQIELNERVIKEILKLNNKIEAPIERISLLKYKMETVKAIGQAERDRLRTVIGNRPPRIKARPQYPALLNEASFRFNGELLTEGMLKDRINCIAEKEGMTVGDGCSEFLDRAVKVFYIYLDVYTRQA